MDWRMPIPVAVLVNELANIVHFRRVLLEPKPNTALGDFTTALVGEPEPKELEKLEATIERLTTELVSLGYVHQANLIRQNAYRSSWDFGPGEHMGYLNELYHTPPVTAETRLVGSTEYPEVGRLLKGVR